MSDIPIRKDGTPLFQAILGAAGVGKSYTVQQRSKEDPNYCIRCSSTGISAINIQGQTIHSLLGFYNTADFYRRIGDDEGVEDVVRLLGKIRSKYKNILIDEVSMLDGQILDLLCALITITNERGRSDKQLGLVVVGDPGQLPVVVSAKDPQPAKPFFEAKSWSQFDIIRLNEVKRQTDADFIRALLSIREGKVAQALEYFESLGFHSQLDPMYVGTTLIARNDEVDDFNRRRLAELEGLNRTYYREFFSSTSGEEGIRSEWKTQIPDRISLKVGAQVVLLNNNRIEGYANGDLARVTTLYPDSIQATLLRNDATVNIQRYCQRNAGYDGTIHGAVEYLPVRLAYAMTVHKTQSLTLDRVQVDLRNSFLGRLSGGLYTALSRARTSSGLRLVGTPEQFKRACFLHPSYSAWIN